MNNETNLQEIEKEIEIKNMIDEMKFLSKTYLNKAFSLGRQSAINEMNGLIIKNMELLKSCLKIISVN